MVSELDPGWTYKLDFSAIKSRSGAFLFCDREQELDIIGLLDLLLIYYLTVECWWWTIAFSFSLILDRGRM